MSLLDRFRPEWKHTDPEVRADAVRQLGASAKQTLAEVARTDTDAKIRSIAVKKIEEVPLLQEIADSDSDERVANLAAERANQLLATVAAGDESGAALEALGSISDAATLVQVIKGSPLEEVRDQALARVNTGNDLLEIARYAPDTGMRKQAISRLEEPEALTSLALQETFGEIALAALERIEDPGAWLRISESAEVKLVREEAARRLGALSDEEHPTRLAERLARQEELIAKVEGLADSTDWEAARDGIESARSSWLEMGAPEDDELGKRFFGARERFIQSFKAHLEEAQPTDPAPPEETSAELEAAAEGGAAEPQATADDAAEPPAEETPATPADVGTAAAAGTEKAEEEAGGEAAAPAEEAAAPEAVAEEAASEETPAEATPASAGEEAPTAATDEAETAVPEPSAAAAGEGGEDSSGEEPAETNEKPSETPERAIARFRSLCDRLDSMASSEQVNLRKAERALREAHSALSGTGPAHSHESWPEVKKHLETARDSLNPRVRQMEQEEEWKRWANVPLQEGLCERMEALLETEDLAKASRELRVLSEEWKTVATVPREKSEELWQRFRGAREKVREKVKGFLQEQDKERKENLKKKTVLCEQAESLADSTDWKETANKLKALQAEWKTIGPVPRKVSDQIWKRFRAPCDEFFNRRKEHFSYLDKEREDNLKRKNALCEEAETLADSTDWEATTDKFKRLQARWKEVGPVPRKVSDQIWKRFRGACDRFFDRRSRKDELPLEENLKKKEAAIAGLEALLPKAAAAPESPAEKTPAAESEAPTEGSPEAAETAPEAAQADEAPVEGAAEAGTGGEDTGEGTEAAAAEEPQEPAAAEEPGPPENLAESLQAALAAWRAAGEVPSNQRGALEERFAAVSKALMEAYPENLEGTELDPKALSEKRQGLVERANSVLSGLRAKIEASKAQPEPSLQDLAQQLKEAFAANTIRKGAQVSESENSFRKARRTLQGLRQRWQELPGEPEAKLAKAFEKVFGDLTELEKEQEG